MATKQAASLVEVMARVFWILVGPGTLSILAIRIADNHQGWFTWRSIAFFIVLFCVAFARWMDPLDSNGEPAAPGQFGKYLAVTFGLGLAGWVLANLLGIYWLDSTN